jgi:hypothetical protein
VRLRPEQPVPQIIPVGIIRLEQRELPFAPPFLDQLFAGNGALDRIMALRVSQPPFAAA